MIGALFMLASVFVCGLSFWAWREDSARYGDALGLSMMLLLSCAISNVLFELYGPADCYRWWPVMDALCGIVTAAAFASKAELWKGALVALFILQCCAHVAFRLQPEKSHGVQHLYSVVLNVSFGAQLIVAAWPGGSRAGLALVGRLLGRAGGHGALVGGP